MRRSPIPEVRTSPDDLVRDPWLNLEMLATAEISSEDPRHPIEHALEGREEGWRSLLPGPQVIRIRFDDPQMISRVHLHFHEAEHERSQEFALFATTKEAARKEIVRQQWAFSPNGATSEIENYKFELQDVTTLELSIDPGRHDKQAVATVKVLKVG